MVVEWSLDVDLFVACVHLDVGEASMSLGVEFIGAALVVDLNLRSNEVVEGDPVVEGVVQWEIELWLAMYDFNVSSRFWMQAHSYSNVFGRSASGAKFLMKSLLKSSHESYDDGANALC